LIVRIAREIFLWGAPRIHGELLMLGLMFPRRPYRATFLRPTGVFDIVEDFHPQ